MGFDWFTLLAQLVNFGLLLVLLRMFLYRPVLNVMRQREERLAAAWADAERVQAEARAEADRLAAERAQLEEQRRQRLSRIEEEAERHRERRLREAETEAAAHGARRAAALEAAREKVVEGLRRRSAELLVDELRDSLADLADTQLDERVAEVFVKRLATLDDEQVKELRTAAAEGPLVLATAHPLGDGERARLSESLTGLLGAGAAPRFETDESLLFGVELRAGALRVAVSGRQRLAALDAAFAGALDELVVRERGGAHAGR